VRKFGRRRARHVAKLEFPPAIEVDGLPEIGSAGSECRIEQYREEEDSFDFCHRSFECVHCSTECAAATIVFGARRRGGALRCPCCGAGVPPAGSGGVSPPVGTRTGTVLHTRSRGRLRYGPCHHGARGSACNWVGKQEFSLVSA